MTRTPAFAYLRVSSTGQVRGHGLDRQAETIAAYAAASGYTIDAEFRDVWTGTEADRPAWADLLAALRANGTRTVIIESLDRLARSVSVQLALLAGLAEEGFTLISATTGQDVTADMRDDPMREAMVIMQGVFAQTEKKLLSRKLRKARDAKSAELGRRVEGAPRFYDDEVVELVRSLRRRRQRATGKGWTPTMIARELEARGVPSKDGTPWTRHAVRRLLAARSKGER